MANNNNLTDLLEQAFQSVDASTVALPVEIIDGRIAFYGYEMTQGIPFVRLIFSPEEFAEHYPSRLSVSQYSRVPVNSLLDSALSNRQLCDDRGISYKLILNRA